MLLTIAALVLEARSVLFLLKRVSIPKVIRVLGPPLLIGFSLLLAATVLSTTGFCRCLSRGWERNQRRQKGHLRLGSISSPPGTFGEEANSRRARKEQEEEKGYSN
jgi:hypothetical protein